MNDQFNEGITQLMNETHSSYRIIQKDLIDPCERYFQTTKTD